MRRLWVYVVVLVVLCGAAVVVARLRLSEIPDLAIGHSEPIPAPGQARERTISYEVDGADGTTAALSYFDADGRLQQVDAPLPWRLSLNTRKLSVATGVIAQSEGSSVGCRIRVDNVIRTDRPGGESGAVTCELPSS